MFFLLCSAHSYSGDWPDSKHNEPLSHGPVVLNVNRNAEVDRP